MQIKTDTLPLFLNGTVIDIETDFDNNITVFGCITGSAMLQFARERYDSYSDFLKECLNHLLYCRHPFYAYYKTFEEKALGVPVDKELQKKSFEAKRDAIHVKNLPDVFKGVGKHCMYAWNEYLEGNNHSLNNIISHNRACLLQELMLVLV